MKPYIVFVVFALLAGIGAMMHDDLGRFLMMVCGLAAVVLPLLMVLQKKN